MKEGDLYQKEGVYGEVGDDRLYGGSDQMINEKQNKSRRLASDKRTWKDVIRGMTIHYFMSSFFKF